MRISIYRFVSLYCSFLLIISVPSPLIAQFSIPFTKVNTLAGINFVHKGVIGGLDRTMEFGTGAVWLDYDQDGDQDLFLTSRRGPNQFYQNQGNGTFTEVSAMLKLDHIGDAGGASSADFNNDGWPDLFVTNCDSADILYKNIGGQYFQNITGPAGIDIWENHRGTSASWGDYDSDGFLDLYVTNHMGFGPTPLTKADYLYHNNGNETFTDVTHLLGIHAEGYGFIGGWTDFDNDGDADIFLVNDCTPGGITILNVPTKLFRNDGGTNPLTWNFTEVSGTTGTNHCQNGMGLAVGDYNRDGWLDYFYSNIGPCRFLENNGNGTFQDKTAATQTGGQGPGIFTWGTSFFDFDLDGWLDIYVAAGQLHAPPSAQIDHLFHHNGTSLTFTDIAFASGLADSSRNRTGVTADYDQDGDLDLFVVTFEDTCKLYRNDVNNGKHYLLVDLQGTTSNRDGIGARLKVTTPDSVKQYFETRSGSNLGGGDDLAAHFGLDTNTVVSELEIKWPSGTVQRLTNVAADQRMLVTEPTVTLPIVLADFELQAQNCGASIGWTTSSEHNSSHFVVERSGDGMAFQAVGEVKAAGESEQVETYHFTDNKPQRGTSYYRLRQVDISGDHRYSRLAVFKNPCLWESLQIYPNPSQGAISLALELLNAEVVGVQIIDLTGKNMANPITYSLDNGSHRLAISHDLPAGLYFCVVTIGDQMVTKKMIVK